MTGMMGMCYATMTGCLTDEEKDGLVEAVGGADVARQVLRGARIIRTVLRNDTTGTILGGLLEETGDLYEFPAVPLFVAREKFVENRDGEVPIAHICGDCQDFLDIIEESVPAVVLKRCETLKRATDRHVIAAFGDSDLVKIERTRSYAAHLYAFLRDEANMFACYTFFVLSGKGNPLSVHAWDDDGWNIEILPVPYPRELETGDSIVTPDSTPRERR